MSDEKNYPVKILRELVHILPVLPAKQRVKGWEETIITPWGTLTVSCVESLSPFDLITFLGIIESFQQAKKRGEVVPTGKLEGVLLCQVITTKYKFQKTCRRNPCDGKLSVETLKSLGRLHDTNWRITANDGAVKNIRPLYGYTWDKGSNLSLTVSQGLIDRCEADGLRVDIDLVANTVGNIAKLLIYWMQGQRSSTYTCKSLSSALHLRGEKKEQMRQLRSGFAAVKSAKGITVWSEQKRYDDTYFIWVR